MLAADLEIRKERVIEQALSLRITLTDEFVKAFIETLSAQSPKEEHVPAPKNTGSKLKTVREYGDDFFAQLGKVLPGV